MKNATEGMAKPVALPVWTVLLLGGHVLPWVLLCHGLAVGAPPWRLGLVAVACLLPVAARLLQARAAREPFAAVPLHPLAILFTLAIQWTALIRRGLGRPTVWRGRAYVGQG